MIDHRLADFFLDSFVFYLVGVFIVVFVHLFGGVAYTEEEKTCRKDYYTQDTDSQGHFLDKSQHTERGAYKEDEQRDHFADMVFEQILYFHNLSILVLRF